MSENTAAYTTRQSYALGARPAKSDEAQSELICECGTRHPVTNWVRRRWSAGVMLNCHGCGRKFAVLRGKILSPQQALVEFKLKHMASVAYSEWRQQMARKGYPLNDHSKKEWIADWIEDWLSGDQDAITKEEEFVAPSSQSALAWNMDAGYDEV